MTILWVGKFKATANSWGICIVSLQDGKPRMSVMEGMTFDQANEQLRYFRGQLSPLSRKPGEQSD